MLRVHKGEIKTRYCSLCLFNKQMMKFFLFTIEIFLPSTLSSNSAIVRVVVGVLSVEKQKRNAKSDIGDCKIDFYENFHSRPSRFFEFLFFYLNRR